MTQAEPPSTASHLSRDFNLSLVRQMASRLQRTMRRRSKQSVDREQANVAELKILKTMGRKRALFPAIARRPALTTTVARPDNQARFHITLEFNVGNLT